MSQKQRSKDVKHTLSHSEIVFLCSLREDMKRVCTESECWETKKLVDLGFIKPCIFQYSGYRHIYKDGHSTFGIRLTKKGERITAHVLSVLPKNILGYKVVATEKD